MKELKTPNLNDSASFEANGKTYHIEQRISVDRKMRVDAIVMELAAGVRPAEQFNHLKRMYDKVNAGKIADVAVDLYKLMEGLKAWQDRKDPILELCAMYINHTDEDRRTISDEQIKAKIADWREAGIDYSFFSLVAHSLLGGQMKTWAENFLASSAQTSKDQESEQA